MEGEYVGCWAHRYKKCLDCLYGRLRHQLERLHKVACVIKVVFISLLYLDGRQGGMTGGQNSLEG